MDLTGYLTLDKSAIDSPNLCDRFTDQDLATIGAAVTQGYRSDKLSRNRWELRNQAALDIAMQVQETKTFPWPGCANVDFPLLTIAAMQFHARAYPAIIQGTDIVKYRVVGEDTDGEEKARAERIGTHMSWQLTEQDKGWEEQLDKALLVASIAGCAFKKSFYSSTLGHNQSVLVLPQDLVVDYYATSIEAARRKTHIIPVYKNEVHERILRGTYRDIRKLGWYEVPPPYTGGNQTANRDKRVGQNPPQSDDSTPFMFLEQHCWMDLDDDGYQEPYAITVEVNSGDVVRIVSRIDSDKDVERTARGEIVSISCTENFTKIPFIPSPDGGIYDIGFGTLLGPLNETANSLINQLLDAGTMATTAGGFLGRGAKMRGGVYSFAPMQWQRVDSTGDDLRKSIYPLPIREPSNVLFQLLSLIIDYSQRVSGSTDMQVGENPGQNTPAQTSQAMIEQGSKIYSAIFKRMWRAMQNEFSKLYILNGQYLPTRVTFGTNGAFALREDYLGDPSRVAPVADPNVMTDSQKIQQAIALKQAAQGNPAYDVDAVEILFLKAIKIDNISSVYKGIANAPQPGPSEKIQIEMIKTERANIALQAQMQMFAAELLEDQRLNGAKIMELQAKAAKAIADAQSEQQYAEVAQLQAMINAEKLNYEKVTRQLELMLKGVELEIKANEPAKKSDGK